MKPYSQLLPNENFESQAHAETYLRNITRANYTFALASLRQWGENSQTEYGQFYQIMPESLDPGFFDWYCLERPYYQFFSTMEAAVMHFFYYWHVWSSNMQE